MCVDPITLLTIGSTALGAVGTIQQGQAAADSANYQSKISERNAQIAQNNADDAKRRGAIAEEAKRLENRAMLGQQRNVLSERNISLASGTPLGLVGDTAMFGEMDALTIRNNFERESVSYKNQSANFSADAAMSRMEAKNARSAAGISAFSTALSGAAEGYSGYRKRKMGL